MKIQIIIIMLLLLSCKSVNNASVSMEGSLNECSTSMVEERPVELSLRRMSIAQRIKMGIPSELWS